jgi:hypothetical protein
VLFGSPDFDGGGCDAVSLPIIRHWHTRSHDHLHFFAEGQVKRVTIDHQFKLVTEFGYVTQDDIK